MSRVVRELEPTRLEKSGGDVYGKLQRLVGTLGEVRRPQDAEEPILERSVRAALFAWLSEIRAKDELAAVKLKPRSTALLFGPPGCGKTTLAHHLAARLGLPLVCIGPENIISSGWGDAEKSLSSLFGALQAFEVPSVMFIDELEAIGGSRDKNKNGGADNARTSLLGVLLRKIETYNGYALGATNRPEDIDKALWRRFHLQIPIELPGAEERFAICKRYLAPYDLPDESMDILVDLTDGASPALLRGVMEGVKRALVLAPKLRIDVSDPVNVFGNIVTTVAPPPEIVAPPLWGRDIQSLRDINWPPVKSA